MSVPTSPRARRNWLARLFRTKAAEPAQIVRLVAAHGAAAWPDLDSPRGYRQQAEEYQRSAWVYVAVTRIAEAAALVPYEVHALAGEARVAQVDHPIERLLRAPNPVCSQFELLEATFGLLELAGNAYWFLAGPPGGAPSEIWPLRPDRVRVVPDEREGIQGYVYSLDGEGIEVPLARDEVIHFKRWHPQSDLYGLSALEAAGLASQSDRAMSHWNRNFFAKEKAVPAGLVTIRNMVDDATYERIQREWRESYGGAERKTAFIRGGEVTWSDLGLSQKDSDFLAARQFNKEEIFHIFGIPPGLYDKNATEANAAIGRQTFLEDTLWPKLVRFGQKLTQQLAPFFGPNLIVAPGEIRDTAPDMAEINAAGPYLTVNEVRARYWNLPPLVWGDRPASPDSAPVGAGLRPAHPDTAPVGANCIRPAQSAQPAADVAEMEAMNADV